jgi:general stress protein 26
MPDAAEMQDKFWKALKSDRTLMLGLAADEGHAQPMTAQLDGQEDKGPIYVFTSKETDLVKALGGGARAVGLFASKGHDLFAAVEGQLSPHNDRATIDRLWNPFVAAWFEDGKDDPKLQLLRFDATDAQIWLNEHSLFAGVKVLLGIDPKESYKDNSATVKLG